MRKLVRYAVIATVPLMTFAIFYSLCADDEGHGERHRHRGGAHDDVKGKHGRNHEAHLGAVTNQTYAQKMRRMSFCISTWIVAVRVMDEGPQ
jgi:hypothetical protein